MPFCDLDDPAETCAAVPGTTCIPFFDEGLDPPGLGNLGLCVAEP